MKVIFRNTWHTPSGRWRKISEPQEVPDEMFALLPSSATVVEGAPPQAEKKRDEPILLRQAGADQAVNTADDARKRTEDFRKSLESLPRRGRPPKNAQG